MSKVQRPKPILGLDKEQVRKQSENLASSTNEPENSENENSESLVNVPTTERYRGNNVNIFPEDYARYLEDGGLYPDIEDPQFVSRLLKKTEFADTVSTFDPKENLCVSGPGFEVTPVQRFVANFLHPRTPYMSALLYHGVGVGKTCAAIQSAEAYLDFYPRRKVFIVCPRAIRPGFYRTIFDMETLKIGSGSTPNTASGCTGDTYLKLANVLDERDPKLIELRIKRAIDSRYVFFGYIEFYNYIREKLKSVRRQPEETYALRHAQALQKEFNYRLLIIDEAHNLRDVTGTEMVTEDEDDIDSTLEKDEAKGGKLLTPYLKDLVRNTEGIKLLLMTATPMFNSVREIIFLLNLMLMNDKKPLIKEDDILNRDGTPSDKAQKTLRELGNAYISFMRGENPISFPLRLYPMGKDPNGKPVNRLTPDNYPTIELTKDLTTPVDPKDKENMSKLPIVVSEYPEGSQQDFVLKYLTVQKTGESGANPLVIDSLLQAGNCIFPTTEEEYNYENPSAYVGLEGFKSAFELGSRGSIKAKNSGKWLLAENIGEYSPKAATILRYLKHAEGVQFVYSRFVKTGALFLAAALEANGYTPQGREPLFLNGIQDGLGKQCALCSHREKEHDNIPESECVPKHKFTPAKYVILTGDIAISPNNKASIEAARSANNVDGANVKIVLGSQIAGEGLDLRFIREVHIYDAWFHLNKTEQIIGRAIRYRSHCLIKDEKKRNTTVFLHVLGFNRKDEQYPSFETADFYCYRIALSKALKVGEISRLLKIYSVDCNLRKTVTILSRIGNRKQIDSQCQPRNGPKGEVQDTGPGVKLDDMDYTAICDWMECKPIVCDPNIENINILQTDDSTYNTFSAKYREISIQKIIKRLIDVQPWWKQEDLLNALSQTGIPQSAIDITLQSIVNNRLFRLQSGYQSGYLIYKNKYFLFQPDAYADLKIPVALRIAQFPVKRDVYSSEPAQIMRPDEPIVNLVEKKRNNIEKKILIIDFWNTLTEWTENVANGTQTKVGIPIERKLELFSGDFKTQKDTYLAKLEILVWFSKKVVEKDKYKKVMLEYLWDEFIMIPKYQLDIISTATPEVAKEEFIESEGIELVRIIDPNSNRLEYFNLDGTPYEGDTSIFENLPYDVVSKRKADLSSTATIYGFMAPKQGIMVFKTQNPHSVGGKPKTGAECMILSQKKTYLDKLITIGKELERYKLPNLGLTEIDLANAALVITNTVKGCTLLDISLRYCDAIRAGKKRWFFRPVAAYFSGHRGKISDIVKSAEKAAQKELDIQEKLQKEREKEAKKTQKITGIKKPTAFITEPTEVPVSTRAKRPVLPPKPAQTITEEPTELPRSAEIPKPKTLKRPTALLAKTVIPPPPAEIQPASTFAPAVVTEKPAEIPPPATEKPAEIQQQPPKPKTLKRPTALLATTVKPAEIQPTAEIPKPQRVIPPPPVAEKPAVIGPQPPKPTEKPSNNLLDLEFEIKEQPKPTVKPPTAAAPVAAPPPPAENLLELSFNAEPIATRKPIVAVGAPSVKPKNKSANENLFNEFNVGPVAQPKPKPKAVAPPVSAKKKKPSGPVVQNDDFI